VLPEPSLYFGSAANAAMVRRLTALNAIVVRMGVLSSTSDIAPCLSIELINELRRQTDIASASCRFFCDLAEIRRD
jgi:hypothetical protein